MNLTPDDLAILVRSLVQLTLMTAFFGFLAAWLVKAIFLHCLDWMRCSLWYQNRLARTRFFVRQSGD